MTHEFDEDEIFFEECVSDASWFVRYTVTSLYESDKLTSENLSSAFLAHFDQFPDSFFDIEHVYWSALRQKYYRLLFPLSECVISLMESDIDPSDPQDIQDEIVLSISLIEESRKLIKSLLV